MRPHVVSSEANQGSSLTRSTEARSRWRLLPAVAALAGLVACDGTGPVTGCGPGALCVRPAPLVVTGTVQASVNLIAGAEVTVTPYAGPCGGTVLPATPSPAIDVTNGAGRYTVGIYPAESAAAACIRVAYSAALSVDTSGVPISVLPEQPETLRINLVGP
jgi:hypothetical protein